MLFYSGLRKIFIAFKLLLSAVTLYSLLSFIISFTPVKLSTGVGCVPEQLERAHCKESLLYMWDCGCLCVAVRDARCIVQQQPNKQMCLVWLLASFFFLSLFLWRSCVCLCSIFDPISVGVEKKKRTLARSCRHFKLNA